MELIRTRTNSEIDRLKSSTKEMYERENRSLREARDMAISERDRALAVEKEAVGRHDTLMQEYVRRMFHSGVTVFGQWCQSVMTKHCLLQIERSAGVK